MISTIVEVTNGFNWGKFMVAMFDDGERAYESKVDPPRKLLRANGWHPDVRWILDLQTGEGALFGPALLPGRHAYDLEKHKIWVCPMYECFLGWFYAHPEHHADIRTLPPLLELTDAETMKASAMYGYRRPGPSSSAEASQPGGASPTRSPSRPKSPRSR